MPLLLIQTKKDSIELEYVSIVIFAIDILLQFDTAYYEKGLLETNRKQIAITYFKQKFLFDIITRGCFIYGISTKQYIFQSLFILAVIDIKKKYTDFEKNFSLTGNIATFSRLLKLIFKLLFISHYVSLAWFYLAKYQLENGADTTWIGSKQESNNMNNYEVYVTAFYWFVCTMSTLGYGDIAAKTFEEKIFVIVCTFVACGAFALAVNTIGDILTEASLKDTIFQQKMANLNIHMRKNNLNQDLQVKVRKYFEYLYIEEQQDDQQARDMLNSLSYTIKEQVLIDLYGSILKSNKIFQLNFSKPFLNKLALIMQDQVFGPEEYIYYQNDIVQRIYFMQKGKVQLIRQDKSGNKQVVKAIQNDGTLGSLEFFKKGLQKYSVVTTEVTRFCYLNLNEVIDVFKDFPQDFEKYREIQDNICLYKDYKNITIGCQYCSQQGHESQDCNKIQASYQKQLIYSKYRYILNSSVQVRGFSDKRRGKKIQFRKPFLDQGEYFINISPLLKKQESNLQSQEDSDETYSDDSSWTSSESDELKFSGNLIEDTSLNQSRKQQNTPKKKRRSKQKLSHKSMKTISESQSPILIKFKHRQTFIPENNAQFGNFKNNQFQQIGLNLTKNTSSDSGSYQEFRRQSSFLRQEKRQKSLKKNQSPKKKPRPSIYANNVYLNQVGGLAPILEEAGPRTSIMQYNITNNLAGRQSIIPTFQRQPTLNDQFIQVDQLNQSLQKIQEINQDFMILMDFDRLITWKNYFRVNNYQNVLKHIKKIQILNYTNQRKSKNQGKTRIKSTTIKV